MTDGSIEFAIQPSSGVPIYRQIMEQICALVVSGRLAAGALVPSIRELAADLEVNMMTVSKAYSRLEADGVLERVRGTGMRVRPIKAAGGVAERQKELEPLVAALVTRAGQLNLSEAQILSVVRAALQERRTWPNPSSMSKN
jgi:GntR family transcriptional regulator